jgi:hypothetical protein
MIDAAKSLFLKPHQQESTRVLGTGSAFASSADFAALHAPTTIPAALGGGLNSGTDGLCCLGVALPKPSEVETATLRHAAHAPDGGFTTELRGTSFLASEEEEEADDVSLRTPAAADGSAHRLRAIKRASLDVVAATSIAATMEATNRMMQARIAALKKGGSGSSGNDDYTSRRLLVMDKAEAKVAEGAHDLIAALRFGHALMTESPMKTWEEFVKQVLPILTMMLLQMAFVSVGMWVIVWGASVVVRWEFMHNSLIANATANVSWGGAGGDGGANATAANNNGAAAGGWDDAASQLRPNAAALAMVPPGGAVAMYALVLVATTGWVGGSYGRAVRDHLPAQAAVVFAYAALSVTLIVLLGVEAHLAYFLDYILLFLTFFVLTLTLNYRIITISNASPAAQQRRAAKAKQCKRDGKPPPRHRPAWRRALKSALPALFITSVVILYVVTIHPLFNACETFFERTAVYAVSLVLVKSGGEKALKYLLENVATGMPERGVDLILFDYELVVSLQARLLLLNMPDAAAVLATSVLTALWELGLRLFFIQRHRSKQARFVKLSNEALAADAAAAATSAAEDGAEEERVLQLQERAASLNGRLSKLKKHLEREAVVLTANTCGDMVVEYSSANGAALILYYFGGYGQAFRFGGVALDGAKLVLALAAQHIPELLCDTVSTWFELRAGLKVDAYFRAQMSWRAQAPKLLIAEFCVFMVLCTMRTYADLHRFT